ncbi:MAG: hypothetical protein IT449_18140 [Phycisphaerales bacterium]|nr:hypothetical protein [Phycisphaerales bacterium]
MIRKSLMMGAAVACLIAAADASAVSFHLMQIEQVIAGVDGDTTAQAIQLRMRSAGQTFISGARLVAVDAAGANPVILVNFGTNVSNGAMGDRVLIATANMSSHTSPPLVADFTMTNRIPDSYLAAGCIIFQNDAGTQILWRLCYGGAGYTGPTTGTLDNDNDGDFAPPFDGALPTSNTESLLFGGAASDKSTTNQDDYAYSGSAAVLTNNARNSFTVQGAPQACDGDETLSAKCKDGTFKVVAKGKNYTPGTDYELCLDGGSCVTKTANDRGIIKNKFSGVAPGGHTVTQTECGLKKSTTCS